MSPGCGAEDDGTMSAVLDIRETTLNNARGWLRQTWLFDAVAWGSLEDVLRRTTRATSTRSSKKMVDVK